MNDMGRQYAKRGVAVLAVNIGESKSTYQDFIQSHQYEYLRWARDSSGEIAKMYQVRSIPTTYVLDKEGFIRYAHVGYGDAVKESLEEEIGTLLE